MLVGKSGSCKTSFTKWLLGTNHPFAAVFVFTGTYSANEYVHLPKTKCYPGFDIDMIALLIDSQERMGEKKQPILIVLDDLMGEIGSTSAKSGFFNKMSITIRKLNISMIILQQTVCTVSKTVRLQATTVLLTTIEGEDVQAFCRLCPGLTQPRLEEILEQGHAGKAFLFDSHDAYNPVVESIVFPRPNA